MKRIARAAMAALLVGAASAATVPADGTLHFDVLRDGSRFGTHVLRFTRDGERLVVDARTQLQVKLAFVTVYKFDRALRETWEGGRLVSFRSETTEDGTKFRVEAKPEGDLLKVAARDTSFTIPADAMPGTLWNKDALGRDRILEPTTGEWLEVRVQELGRETIAYGGRPTEADHFLLTGLPRDYHVWYLPDGELARIQFSSRGSDILFVADPSR